MGTKRGDSNTLLELARQAEELGRVQGDLEIVKKEKTTLEKVYRDEILENQRLADLVETLRNRDPEIRVVYIEKVVESTGTLEGETTNVSIEDNECLEPHEYRTKEGLRVADLEKVSDNEYAHTTHDITIDVHAVTTDKEGVVDVIATSSAEPDNPIRIKQSTRIIEVDEPRKAIQPQVDIGVGFLAKQKPELTGTLGFQWLTPHDNVFVLGPRIHGNQNTFGVSVDVVSYNIGAPIPVLKDTWISVGPGYTHRGEWMGAITITSRM